MCGCQAPFFVFPLPVLAVSPALPPVFLFSVRSGRGLWCPWCLCTAGTGVQIVHCLGHPVPVGCGAASVVSTHQMPDGPLHHGSPCPFLWDWLPWTLKCSSQGVHAVEVVWGKGSIQSVCLPSSLNCASFGILAPCPPLTSFHGHFYLFLAGELVCHKLFHC